MVESSVLGQLDLVVLEKVGQIFFDQMGFSTKIAGRPPRPGVAGVAVLHSKSSGEPFALCQCAAREARVDLELIRQFQGAMAKLGLVNGYLIAAGGIDQMVRQDAQGSRINLIDSAKFAELINNLPDAGRRMMNDTITAARVLKKLDDSSRHQRQAEVGTAPNCAKCGRLMKLEVSVAGKYRTGRYWQCPNPDCRHIAAIV